MDHLDAELARFEAEIAGRPAPSAAPGPAFLGPHSGQGYPPAQLPQQLPPPPGFASAPYAPAALPPPPMRPAYMPPQPMPAPQPAPVHAARASTYYVAPSGPPAMPVYAAAAPQYTLPVSKAPRSAEDALADVKAALQQQAQEKKKKAPAVPRAAGGEKWWDSTLLEWPENDFRIFVGDLGNEVNDDVLQKSFQKFTSFQKGKVVRDKRTNKTKGYGFVSFTDPIEGAKALREMDGKYIGNRPCKLRKSTWDERIDQQQVNKKKRKGNFNGKPILNPRKHVGVLHR
ncbi:hypothetical protein CVIRNUC_007784 [Coccomyxa viridis]|uniref:RRM domain-containing protein n=1 Tax=Coccomyxa viridis TaxID=1274662 RepID=A0AAV1IF19_9CHLO|nr:hypothetical protein CVIRNUC_007784 [Coccomyxa viridis]